MEKVPGTSIAQYARHNNYNNAMFGFRHRRNYHANQGQLSDIGSRRIKHDVTFAFKTPSCICQAAALSLHVNRCSRGMQPQRYGPFPHTNSCAIELSCM